MGLCAETVQSRELNGRRPLKKHVLAAAIRIETGTAASGTKREIRQSFGAFRHAPANFLTDQ
jgi:hypothetical protein